MLLAAAGAGWLARRVGLPAVVGYLVVGLAVSPFTPGYVAEPRPARAVRRRRRRAPAVRGRDRGRPRAPAPRAGRPPLGGAAADGVTTVGLATGVFLVAGLEPSGAALLGLAVALSSSVVIVNITRSRRRTTDRPTERVARRLGRAPGRDRGRRSRSCCSRSSGPGSPLAESLLGLRGVRSRWSSPRPGSCRLRSRGSARSTTCSCSCRSRPVSPWPARERSWRGSRSRWRPSSRGWPIRTARRRGGASPAAALPRRIRRVLLRRRSGTLIDPDAVASGLPWLALARRARRGRQVGRSPALLVRLTGLSRAAAARSRSGSARSASSASSSPRSRSLAVRSVRTCSPAVLAAVVATIAGSTILVRLVGHPAPELAAPEA